MGEHGKMSERVSVHRSKEFLEEESILDIKTDFMARLVTIIVAALGLITALAWDRTLEDIFIEFFGPLDSLAMKLIYAILITFLAVAVTLMLRNTFIRKEAKNQRRHRHHPDRN